MTIWAWFSFLSILFPVIAGTIRYKQLNTAFKFFFIFAWIGVLTEMTSYYMTKYYHFNHDVFYVYFLIEAEFLSFFIIFTSFTKKYRKLAITIGVLFLALWIYLAIYGDSITDNLILYRTIAAFVVSCITAYALYVLTNTSEGNLFINPLFWIQVGVLVYFFGTLFYFYTLNWEDSNNQSIMDYTMNVHHCLNFIYNLCQATAFWLFRKVRTFTF